MKPFLLLSVALLLRAIAFQLGPVLSDDVYRYHWDGHVQAYEFNPYQHAPDSAALSNYRDEHYRKINHPAIKTIYPPVAQLVFRLAYAVYPHPTSQRLFFLFFDVGVVVLLLLLLAHRKRNLLWAAVYAWNPLVVLEYAASGHNDSLMLFFLMGSLLLYEKKKEKAAGVLLGLSVLSKFIPLLIVPWLLVQRRWRFLGCFALTVLVGALPFFAGLDGLSGLQTFATHWVFNASLFWLAQLILPEPTVIKIIFGLFLFTFSFYTAYQAKDDLASYILILFIALLLLSPVVHPWYVTWIVPFLCLIPLRGGLVWSMAVLLTYVVLIRYKREGIWLLPLWVRSIEYALVYGFFTWDGLAWLKSSFRSTVPPQKDRSFRPVQWISVVIPALNEENAVGKVIADIPRDRVKEIIVVDNGSKDNTIQVARDAGAHVVEEPRPGYGRAVLAGLRALDKRCDTVVILDGDYSDYPADLSRLIETMETEKADMVLGSRVQQAQRRSLTPQQRFGNWLTCFLIQTLYGTSFTDMGPFRVIRKESLDSLHMQDQNYGWNVEMQVKALRKGMTVREVPVRYRPRIGHSKISGTIKGTVMAGVIILRSVFRYGRVTV